MVTETADQHAVLRDDVRMLGHLLGMTVKQQAGEAVYNSVEKIRLLAKAINKGDAAAYTTLLEVLRSLPTEQLVPVTKAFSQFLNFANIAEQYHRIRRTRLYKMNPTLGPQLGSLEDGIPKLLAAGVSKQSLFQAILKLDIQFVLTSHPTEVKRRTVMLKYNRITAALAELDDHILTPAERAAVKDNIQQEMTAVWQTPEVRSQKPTAIDEAKWGYAIIESSIWHAVPRFLRELQQVVRLHLDKELPLSLSPIKIDSWLGGDRDGNPNVTPAVTRRVVFIARWVAADLFLREIRKLRESLSMAPCNAKLRSIVGETTEPYRVLLKQVQQRLKATRGWARDNFAGATAALNPYYEEVAELLEPLLICYESLHECKAGNIADGLLLDIIRQVQCFGLALVRTDIRQEASRHTELLAVVTKYLALGNYSEWSESQRQVFLLANLENPPNLDLARLPTDAVLQDTIDTFRMLVELPRASLGSYVISMAAAPSDVLAVVFLQRVCGVSTPLPVVPLFEKRTDLENAAQILDTLLSIDSYRNMIGGAQQVMIGYSDSAKDVGMLAAAWAQYRAQEEMLTVAARYGIDLLFFHGRGGSLGRGGWPTHSAILSQPPGSVHGVMRVTQQGEVIQNRFGLAAIALRTFSVYATSTLEATLLPQPAPKPEWRELIGQLAQVSAVAYKSTISERDDFLHYFQTATPTRELKRLAIGSRPDSRTNADSLSKLRAIPWIFAWTQNRLLLPSWIGVGTALQHAFDTGRAAAITDMRRHWTFFQTVLSMSEMVLSKVDTKIAAHYQDRLVPQELRALGDDLRRQFDATRAILLQVLGKDKLLAKNHVLDRSINLRNPYLLPLHLLQVELLYRVREQNENAPPELITALLTTIVGIAAGMRNTG